VHRWVRALVQPLEHDRPITPDLERLATALETESIV